MERQALGVRVIRVGCTRASRIQGLCIDRDGAIRRNFGYYTMILDPYHYLLIVFHFFGGEEVLNEKHALKEK